mgnify:CR=1 FL=1
MPAVFDPHKHHYIEPGDPTPFAYEPGWTLAEWAEPGAFVSDALPAGCERLVVLDRLPNHGGAPDGDAESRLRSWSQTGWERFDAMHAKARDRARERGVVLLVRPSSAGMLSDAVSTLNWVARGGGRDAMLMLDPMGWIVASMMRDLPDHLDRICALCIEMVEHGRVGCVLMRSYRGAAMDRASLTDGDADASVVIRHLGPLIERAPLVGVLEGADLGMLGAHGPQ